MIQGIKDYIRNYFLKLNFSGVVFAIVFYCFSMLPSLLPRPALYQGLISGISVVIGYGIGVAFSRLVRWLLQREVVTYNAKSIAWRIVLISGLLLLFVFVFMGGRWQDQVRLLVGEPESGDTGAILMLLVATVTFVLFLAIARLLRKLTRWVNKQFAKVMPKRLAISLGVLLIIMLFGWIVSGLFANAFIATANNLYKNKNNTTPEGVQQPSSLYRSGSENSLIQWNTLGYQGQAFTGGGPSVQQIANFTNTTAIEPIRVYAGINSAATPQARASLVVEELKRTKAFDRDILVLATATGTGWLEPQSVDSIEYMYGGNTAIVAQQYSYLPSWISFLVDKDNATTAAQALYDAVFAEWSKLPIDNRPKLIAYGLSLGSFGGQSVYVGINDLTASIDGALFMGTPNDTALWRSVTKNRDPSSPEILPIYKNGVSARFAATNEQITNNQNSWLYPRILYMQHASDPVVWFSFDLLFNEPDWLKEPRGPDVFAQTRWFPFVTFFQVTVDQFFGTTVPNGHGHNYANTIVNAWSAVTNPPNWNTEKQEKLQEIINAYSSE